jgi:hypothetical protein
MAAKRDGATLAVDKESVALELVKMLSADIEKQYEQKFEVIVDAYRLVSTSLAEESAEEQPPVDKA